MAGAWVHTIPWAQGQQHTQGIDIGPPGQLPSGDWRGAQASAFAGVLRIGFTGLLPTVRFRAEIRMADNGNIVGPIDLPTVCPAELPARVEITPDAPLAAPATVQIAAIDDTSWYGRFQVHTTVLLTEAGGSARLPPWCTGVSLLTPAVTADWRDAADAVVLGTFAGNQNPRPKLAHFIRSAEEALYAILHYNL